MSIELENKSSDGNPTRFVEDKVLRGEPRIGPSPEHCGGGGERQLVGNRPSVAWPSSTRYATVQVPAFEMGGRTEMRRERQLRHKIELRG